MKKTVIFATLLALTGLTMPVTSVAAADGKKIVVTIKPLHSLVQAVLGEHGEAELLLSGATSVHGYNLKPSQVAALHEADVVFYIHEHLETFLPEEVLHSEKSHAAAEVATLLPTRKKGHRGHRGHRKHRWLKWWRRWHDSHEHHHGDEDGDHGRHDHEDHEERHEGHDHDEHDDHGDDHGHGKHDDHDEHGDHDEHHRHDHGKYDLHIWMDVDNAKAIVRQVADVLSAQMPAHAADFQKNSAAFQERLSELDDDIAAQLAEVASQPYVVFHDAYQYVEARYGLKPPTILLVSPHVPPSAKRLKRVQRRIARHDIHCAFREPQFSDKAINAITGGEVHIGELDPLGATVPAGEGMYVAWLTQMADNLHACLKK